MSYRIKSPMSRGPLGLVLKLSRIAGMAPYTHAPEFKVSRTLATCGKVFIIINGISVMSFVVEDFGLTIKNKKAISATQVIVVLLEIALTTINVLGVFTAPARITRMADYLHKLNQYKKILHKKSEKSLQVTTNYKIFVSIGGFLVLNVLDFLARLKLFPTLNYASTILNALLVLNFYLLVSLLLPIIFFAKSVNLYLIALNDNLQRLISNGNIGLKNATKDPSARFGNDASLISPNINNHRNENDERNVQTEFNKVLFKPVYINVNAFVSATKTGEKKLNLLKVRELATLYQLICEIVLKTSEADGVVVMLFLVIVTLYLETNVFLGVILGISDLPWTHVLHGVFFSFSFALFGIAFLIFLVEQYHQTHSEMDRTYDLIINRKPIEDEVEMEHELELFHRMLFLNKVTYSPLDLFTIDRALVMKLFSGLITYLVITFEYGPETRNLFRPNATVSSGK